MKLFLFRTRKPSRDRETDIARVEPIVAAFADAIKSANVELDGLRQRLEQMRTYTTFLFDHQDNDENQLPLCDNEMVLVCSRLADLRAKIWALKELNGRVLEIFCKFPQEKD